MADFDFTNIDNVYHDDGGVLPTQINKVYVDLTVKWAKMTLYFDENGGGAVSNKTVYYNRAYGTLPTTSKTGYTFDGWFTSEAWTTEVLAGTICTKSADHTLYAKHNVNYYTVTWKDYNGATLKTESVAYLGNGTPPSNPTRAGYTFNGWSGQYYGITGNVTITATYNIIAYTLNKVTQTGLASHVVTRTSSPNAGASLQVLTDSSVIYYGDVLAISAVASDGYSASVSGSPVTVTGNTDTDDYITITYAPMDVLVGYIGGSSSSLTFYVENENPYTVRLYYEVNDSTPDANYIDLAAGDDTNVTFSGLSSSTSYDCYFRFYKLGYYSSTELSTKSTSSAGPTNWSYEHNSVSASAYSYDVSVDINTINSIPSSTNVRLKLMSLYPPGNYSYGTVIRAYAHKKDGSYGSYYWFEAE